MTALLLTLTMAGNKSAPLTGLIPEPVQITVQSGSFQLDESTAILYGPGCEGVARLLSEQLSPGTGLPLPCSPISKKGAQRDSVEITVDPSLGLGPEGYKLTSKSSGVEIVGQTPAGAFYGTQTLRQLAPTETLRGAPDTKGPIRIPAVTIADYPRFGWRGAHLDVGRHFMPKQFIERYIDLLSFHKLNVFHWHLTEDQGWRIAIEKYPKLTEVGAWRSNSMLTYDPPTYDGKPHGGYYTQADVKEIVAYAKRRFVTVVPEIEMPGHSQAAVAAYPELGNTSTPVPVLDKWGVTDHVMKIDAQSVKFCEDVLTEVMGLFPSEFIHVGGDEAPTTEWEQSPEMSAEMKKLGISNARGLQSWFTHQIDAFLTEHHRRLVGWDEILEGGQLAPGATVMSWRGEEGGIAAAKAGHDVVMAPSQYTYFDHYQSRDRGLEPHAIGGLLTLKQVYDYNPVPASMTAEDAKHVLGAQCQIWTEYIPDPLHVEYMAFPRLCAFSEVVWSPQPNRNWADFSERMVIEYGRLDALGVNYRRPDPNEPILGIWTTRPGTNAYIIEPHQVVQSGAKTIRVGVWLLKGHGESRIESATLVSGQNKTDAVIPKGGVLTSDNDRNVLEFPGFQLDPYQALTLTVEISGGADADSGEFVLLPDPADYHPYAIGSP